MRSTILAAALLLTATSSAFAQTEADCFDAEVTAQIVHQTPTVIGQCDDCIIVSWPWILDIDVRRVHSGSLERGALTVLTVQHTYFRRGIGVVRWKLRRNTLHGFNVVGLWGNGPDRRCAIGELPATAYVTPPEGKDLDDLRREGQALYDWYSLNRAAGSIGNVTSDTSHSSTPDSTRSRPSLRAFAARNPIDSPSSAPARLSA